MLKSGQLNLEKSCFFGYIAIYIYANLKYQFNNSSTLIAISSRNANCMKTVDNFLEAYL